jgi:DNA-binding MarR family transcriptional regulator
LEFVMAVLAAFAVLAWFGRVEARQGSNPRLDRGERAIWRLSYRQGKILTLEQILEFTLLDESTVLATLRQLEAKGEAQLEPDGRWRLLEPNKVGPARA